MKNNRTEGIELIKELSLAFGPTGFEDEVRELIYAHVKELADEVRCDKMGNMCAIINGSAPDSERKKIMISAHMDEVGFIIKDIDKDGYIKLSTVGGIDNRVIAGKRVIFKSYEGNTVRDGVIAVKAIHHKARDERDKVTTLDKMYADIGSASKEETESLFAIGDYAVFDSAFVTFGADNKYIKSKALDDRMGCAAMIEIMRRIRDEGIIPENDIIFGFTVREETGLSGAGVTAHRYKPDYSIVLECTAVADIPGTPEWKKVATLGEGGAISLVDRSTIYPQEFIDLAMKTAKEKNIKAQIKKYVSGGNDAGHIHKSGNGVKTLAVSAPTRYLHSPACVAHYDDYIAIRDLVFELAVNTIR
ncbi:MAG: M42 family metallopeptidase [Ruminococcaceae bacterium]|nr:M42 family metallopeptidase [Oscillospiraceae bacterium]